MLDDLLKVGHESLAFWRQFLRGLGEGSRVKKAVQGNIYLVVLRAGMSADDPNQRQTIQAYRWDFAILEGADDTVELELAVDISLLLLDVGGLVDARGSCASHVDFRNGAHAVIGKGWISGVKQKQKDWYQEWVSKVKRRVGI